MAAIVGIGRDALMCLVLVVAVLVLCLSPIQHVAVEGASEDLELDAQLNNLNKPPIKTIHTEWGDILDCIDIHKQPAFDHPLLKNHKIQMKPTSIPRMARDESSSKRKYETSSFQTLAEACPKGTVPIRRTQIEDLVRAKSLPPRTSVDASNGNETQYLGGFVYESVGETYYGVGAVIDIYNPNVVQGQFSKAAIALEGGPADKSNGINFGWMVNPNLYGDNLTRLFTYWTSDGGKDGCYNTLCAGFVQVHEQITPGTPLQTSTYGGTQYVINVRVFQDINGTNDWWLQLNETINVGYWPSKLFPLLSAGAPYVYWGGDVLSRADGLSPQMGNGHYPEGKYNYGCYFAFMQIVDESFIQVNPKEDHMKKRLGCSKLYNTIYYGYQKELGHTFLFGGPGGQCV